MIRYTWEISGRNKNGVWFTEHYYDRETAFLTFDSLKMEWIQHLKIRELGVREGMLIYADKYGK